MTMSVSLSSLTATSKSMICNPNSGEYKVVRFDVTVSDQAAVEELEPLQQADGTAPVVLWSCLSVLKQVGG